MYHCMSCFRISRTDLPVCVSCGRSAPSARVCANGHVNSAKASVCHTCGTHRLTQPATPPSRLNRVLWHVTRGTITALGICIPLLVIPLVMRRISVLDAVVTVLELLVAMALVYRASLVLPGPITRFPFPPPSHDELPPVNPAPLAGRPRRRPVPGRRT